MGKILQTSISVILMLGYSFGAELTNEQKSKLHPFFQTILSTSQSQQSRTFGEGDLLTSVSNTNNEILYNAIVYTDNANAIREIGLPVNSVYSEFITTQVTQVDLLKLTSLECVKYIDPGTKNYPQLEVSVPEMGVSLLHAGYINSTQYKGSGAIVLIYDSGIDWKHLDFRKSDTTKSRILYIWDQTLSALGGETPPSGFSYGVEYTQAQIENELDGTPANFVREKDINGHGTHVAGIAAGNGQAYNSKYIGVAPEADIIVVKGGDNSFNETRMIDGLTYANNKAIEFGKPIVVNWSIGGHNGAHDGTRPYEYAINQFVRTAGRVVCVAAGNSGANAIHTEGSVSNTSADSVMVIIPTYTPTPGENNDNFYLDVWTRNTDAITATLYTPSGFTYTITAGGTANDQSCTDGAIYVVNNIVGSHRMIFMEVKDANASYPPKNGTWKIRLTKSGAGTTLFDAWLSSYSLGSSSPTLVNGNTNKTVTMPGTADSAITVGAYVTKPLWPDYRGGTWGYGYTESAIAPFSGLGPTADGRIKPDISSPGSVISSALSSNVDTTGRYQSIQHDQKHWVMQGTSMATPQVAGACALLLGANSSLNAIQIRNLFTSTANVDSYTGSVPNNTWGYGKIDVVEAMAKSISGSATVTRTILSYDGNSLDSYVTLTGTRKLALRFTPTMTGKLTGLNMKTMYQTVTWLAGSGPLVCEIYTNSGGLPGTKLGSTVYHPFSLLTPGTTCYVQMLNANVNVSAGVDYHIVLSTSNASDTLRILVENGVSSGRSSYYNGTSWSSPNFNFRIRPIVTTVSGMVEVENSLAVNHPQEFKLHRNFPNPFNPSTTIRYELPYKTKVKLEVFDVLGRLVSTLVDLEQEQGKYEVKWNGKSDDGASLSSGIYFYRLNGLSYSKTGGNFSKTERMLLLK